MRLAYIGRVGTDAGYWVFENGKWVHKGGWAIEQMAEIQAALNIISEANKLKTPGLGDAVSKVLTAFVSAQLEQHVEGAKGGTVMVFG